MYHFFHLKCFIAILFFKGKFGLLLMKPCTILIFKRIKKILPSTLSGTYAQIIHVYKWVLNGYGFIALVTA